MFVFTILLLFGNTVFGGPIYSQNPALYQLNQHQPQLHNAYPFQSLASISAYPYHSKLVNVYPPRKLRPSDPYPIPPLSQPKSPLAYIAESYPAPQKHAQPYLLESYPAPQKQPQAYPAESYPAPQKQPQVYPAESYPAPQKQSQADPAESYPVPQGQPQIYPTTKSYQVPQKSPQEFPVESTHQPNTAKPQLNKETNKEIKNMTNKIIVAHRGASGYLPENTLESKVLGFQMGADYLEQDLVMTKDNYLVVVHDLTIDGITNVKDAFPGRNRDDGKFYVIDFTLDEIKSLKSTVNFEVDQSGNFLQQYPNRFPLFASDFSIHTFEEEIELIQGLNKVLSKDVGLFPDIKAPWFHRKEGRDITAHVMNALKQYGYTKRESKCYVQCFDPNELKRCRDQLLPQLGMDLKLLQLISPTSWNETFVFIDGKWEVYNYDWMVEDGGMERISKFADAVGPWHPMVINDKKQLTNLVKNAHKNKLEVFPYTFRTDKGQIPHYAKNFEDMLHIFLKQANVDGIFTDFPDIGAKWRDNN